MVTIIDFNTTSRQAFKHGFIKGLAAPVMLFGNFAAPTLPIIPAIQLDFNQQNAFDKDWQEIGKDFRKVIANYESETKATD